MYYFIRPRWYFYSQYILFKIKDIVYLPTFLNWFFIIVIIILKFIIIILVKCILLSPKSWAYRVVLSSLVKLIIFFELFPSNQIPLHFGHLSTLLSCCGDIISSKKQRAHFIFLLINI